MTQALSIMEKRMELEIIPKSQQEALQEYINQAGSVMTRSRQTNPAAQHVHN